MNVNDAKKLLRVLKHTFHL